MRRLASVLALLLTLLTMAPAARAEAPVRVVVGIWSLDFDTPPIIEQGRTLVPLRALAEALGFAVAYDPAERRITLTKGDQTVELWVGFTKAKVNGKDFALEAAPKLVDSRTLVPLRFVSEQLGAVVTWNERDRLVHVERGEDYARGLYETAQQKAQATPFSDGKSQANLTMAMKMSGPELPPGGISMESPMSMEMHMHQGDLLMSMTTSERGPAGMETMTMKMAVKDGISYMLVPGVEQWMVVGEGSLEDALEVGSPFDMNELMALDRESVKDATFRLHSIEEKDGARVARVDVALSTNAINDVYAGVMGPLGALPEGLNMQMTVDRFNLSQWIDVATGKIARVTLEMEMSLRGSESGASPVEMRMSMKGDITYSHVSEPIQFPDLSGAVHPDELDPTELGLD